MSNKSSRRRAKEHIQEGLRNLRAHLSLLNHHVGTRVDLRDVDLECLDLLDRHGTLSPTALARAAGLHPATMTGILDRLERTGWVTRDRAESDRRAVLVRLTQHRQAEMLRLYSGMNAELNRICAGYSDEELELIAGFLDRVSTAGRTSAEKLADS